jgi:putative membrane protein
VGLLPGIGSSQAGVIAAQIFKAKTKEFLTALGGINTSNIIFTFISLYAIGKTRSGAAWALSEIIDSITINDVLIIITIAATTAFISAIFTLKAGKIIAARMRSVNYRLSNLTIIAILFVLVFFFTGFVGCFICGISIALGLLCITSGARRTNLMGFLILPTIIYFAGLSPYVLSHTSL